MSGKFFKSTGTIRIEFTPCSPKQPWVKRIFLTPATDSTVHYGDKRYAVFLPTPEIGACLEGKLVYAAGEEVEIKVNADLPGLVEAAIQKTLVEVEVKVLEKGSFCNFSLLAITIPARGKQK